jgi:hypothetical protein
MRLILILTILSFVQCLMACSVVEFYNIKFGAPSAISTNNRYKCIDKKSKLELTLEGVEGNKGRRFWMWVKMKLAID